MEVLYFFSVLFFLILSGGWRVWGSLLVGVWLLLASCLKFEWISFYLPWLKETILHPSWVETWLVKPVKDHVSFLDCVSWKSPWDGLIPMLTSGCTSRNQGTTSAFGLIGLTGPKVGPCGAGWSTPCLLCTHPVHVCRVLPCWTQCGWVRNGRKNSGHSPRGGESFGDCLSLVALVGCVTCCPSWAWLLRALGGYVPTCPGWICS